MSKQNEYKPSKLELLDFENVENKIKFKDFLKVDEPSRTKVKFNMNASNREKRALDLLFDSDNDEWMRMIEYKTKHPNNNYSDAKYVIALAQYYPYGPEYFLFGGFFRIEKVIPETWDDRGYKLTLLDDYKQYIKRLIIRLNKSIGRDVYNRWYENLDFLEPEIYELAPHTKLFSFLGYQNVRLQHKDLQRIILNKEPSWKQALSNIKGVYVITDMETGKLYIGSASGNSDGIWQRWSSYADVNKLTGGNVDFKKILEEKGSQYIIDNFQYSILEIFDTKTKQDTIIEREEHWKKVFDTKKHFNYNN